ncbi:hypothetical protein EK21DRAFT_113525 [Setomelanomma holmii]|uniref:Uncharacterized protein n=1 Tax=Setomelanomma holmii TaxID=210430 RepID=A0A9P4LLN3_9PLEO|nr:hypothetical protein EK21DRAFT_113525 [Setomelanomma holmii]
MLSPHADKCRYGSSLVTIRLDQGDAISDFAVYEKLIRASSDFINNALKGRWRESTDSVIFLPDFKTAEFDKYYRWLLTGRLRTKSEHHWLPEPGETIEGDDIQHLSEPLRHEVKELGRLSYLGHYLCDSDFQDTVSDAMIQCTHELGTFGSGFPFTYAPEFYKLIPQSSRTRCLIVDLIAWTRTESSFYGFCSYARTRDKDDDHMEFMIGVFEACGSRFLSSEPQNPPWGGSWCKYHSHGT